VTLCFVTLPLRAADPDCKGALAALSEYVKGRYSKSDVVVDPRLHFLKNFLEYPAESLGSAMQGLYPELRWLTKKVEISPEDAKAVPHEKSHSVAMFGEFHPEVDRTVTSILVLQQILAGDYEGMTATQAPPVRLKPESFEEVRRIFLKILGKDPNADYSHLKGQAAIEAIDPEKLDAMVTYMAIHDLGKSKTFANVVEKVTLKLDPDHDRILVYGLGAEPMLSLSYERLGPKYKQLIMQGMQADFNMGQFAQAENVPGSMEKLLGLNSDAFDFYFVHLMLDVAGATGVREPSGSKVMIEPVYKGFSLGHEFLPELFRGKSPVEVYDQFLKARATQLGLPFETPADRAMARVALLSRAMSSDAAAKASQVFNSLPKNEREVLISELNRNGFGDGHASLLYYFPAMIDNARKGTKDSDEGLRIGLQAAARVFSQARTEYLKGKKGSGVYTVNIKQLADLALEKPRELNRMRFEFKPVGDGADVTPVPFETIDATQFPQMKSLGEIPGDRVGLIGIGGGSDGIQAAQMAAMLKGSGKSVPFVISVRTEKTNSLVKGNTIGAPRTVENPAEVVGDGVFKIGPQTTGSGRFLENLPASDVPMYLVIDRGDGKLQANIQKAMRHAGGATTTVAVDTGGDALFGKNGKGAEATPDQDRRVLQALAGLKGTKILTAEIAVGVDAPDNVQQVLTSAKAKFYSPSTEETERVLQNYAAWKMDGSSDDRYGKTSLAWQAALRDKEGVQAVDLPARVVTGETPWSPFVPIQPSMKGIFVMDLPDHLNAIGASEAPAWWKKWWPTRKR